MITYLLCESTMTEMSSVVANRSLMHFDTLPLSSSPSGYISQTMPFAPLGLSTYRVLSYEEIEDATNNFDSSAFMGEGSQGQV